MQMSDWNLKTLVEFSDILPFWLGLEPKWFGKEIQNFKHHLHFPCPLVFRKLMKFNFLFWNKITKTNKKKKQTNKQTKTQTKTKQKQNTKTKQNKNKKTNKTTKKKKKKKTWQTFLNHICKILWTLYLTWKGSEVVMKCNLNGLMAFPHPFAFMPRLCECNL